MTVYQTDYEGRYVGSIQLGKGDICPKTGVDFIPGRCVTVKPPEIPDGKELFWHKDEWVLRDKLSEQEEEKPIVS